MSNRNERANQYEGDEANSNYSLSSSLKECALSEFRLAADDRCRGLNEQLRTEDNHWSPHALGSILLLVAALEAWTGELIPSIKADKKIVIENSSVSYRLRKICKEVFRVDSLCVKNLDILVGVRHEIAHHLPRKIVSPEGNRLSVPTWLEELETENLLVEQMVFPQNLASYCLARWSFQVVHKLMDELDECMGESSESDEVREVARGQLDLFKFKLSSTVETIELPECPQWEASGNN